MKRQLKSLFNSIIPKRIREAYLLHEWGQTAGYAPPSPHFVKQAVLLRHGIKDCTWIETGTFLGSTTKLLAQNFKSVHTIEPSAECLAIARRNTKNDSNITFYNGTSEDYFEQACGSVNGDICFWLDGHYSAGITYQGEQDSPILHELSTIEKYLHKYHLVVVIVDDIRCSHLNSEDYPSLNFYVEWANKNNLQWIIEHDAFIAKSAGLAMYP